MAAGDRNMLQRYRKERQRNILAKPGTHEFVIVLDGLKPGYNVAKIFRGAEAFGARAVHLINIGPFDPAPAKGSFRKVPAHFHDSAPSCLEELARQGYALFLLDPSAGQPLMEAEMPRQSAFIFGHEEFGTGFDSSAFPQLRTLAIPQFGQVQSLNVSIAAAVVMYEYVRRYTPEGDPGE